MFLAACAAIITCDRVGALDADDEVTAKVEQRIRDWQPTKAERRLDDIGWARDIRDALRLAKESGRPVFLFTYDGASLGSFRC
jgi:hypothetical protein